MALDASSPQALLRPVFAPFFLALLGVLAGVFVVDRVVGWVDRGTARSDPTLLMSDGELGWVPRPGYRSETIRLDSHGLRNPEIPSDAPPDEVRILVVGASHVFGLGLTDEETWRPRLEEALSAKHGVPIRVLNAGVLGYSLVQKCRRARRLILEVEPDIIIVFTYPVRQTMLDTSPALQWVQFGERMVPASLLAGWPESLRWIPARLHQLGTRSHIYVRHRNQVRLGGPEFAHLRNFVLTHAPVPPLAEERLRTTKREVAEFAAECERRGLEARFVMLHDHHGSSDGRWHNFLRHRYLSGGPPLDTPRREPIAALAEFLRLTGAKTWNFFPVISLLGLDGERSFQEDNAHWSEYAHGVMAQALERELTREGLVEQAAQRRASRPRGAERGR